MKLFDFQLPIGSYIHFSGRGSGQIYSDHPFKAMHIIIISSAKNTLSNVKKKHQKTTKNNSPGASQLFPRVQKSKNCRPLNFEQYLPIQRPMLFGKKTQRNSSEPGDSSRDLLIPDCWRSLNPLKGSRFHHPQKRSRTRRIAR